jgi:hypothetical protein
VNGRGKSLLLCDEKRGVRVSRLGFCLDRPGGLVVLYVDGLRAYLLKTPYLHCFDPHNEKLGKGWQVGI